MFVYVREHGDDRLLVALNFGNRGAHVDASDLGTGGTVLVSTTTRDRDPFVELGALRLDPYEGLVVALVGDGTESP